MGDSGAGKSPGSDALFRDVLPLIEARMGADFPDRLREYQAACEMAKAARENWEKEVRTARKRGLAPPRPPSGGDVGAEPQMPRLRQNDITHEKVALLLANAAPKGLLMAPSAPAGIQPRAWLFASPN